LLLAIKSHAADSEMKTLIEDLTQKLVATGKNCLSVNVLFMLA
jgi:high-affinity nickel permease